MKTFRIQIMPFLLIVLFWGLAQQAKGTNPDSVKVVQLTSKLNSMGCTTAKQRLVEVGKMLLGLPYKAATLEVNKQEQLVVNLGEFDCTTFVETCLALAMIDNASGNAFDNFKKNLTWIRYRNGQINGYVSRLHYLTDWGFDNEMKGILINSTFANSEVSSNNTLAIYAVPYKKEINFMSRNWNKYPALVADTLLVADIAKVENQINSRRQLCISKNGLPALVDKITEGCIVAFTTTIAGLDVVHVGITIKVNGKIHLLHASSDAGKVAVSDKTLDNYVLGNKLQSGIILFDPIFSIQ